MEWSINRNMRNSWYQFPTMTWYRYLFRSFLSLTLLFTLLGFSLFIIGDAISHIKDICDPKTTWTTWINYYISLFIYRLETLIPFSITIATVLSISRLVKSYEFLPLVNAGLSLQQISQPLFTASLLASLVLLANNQYTYPQAIETYKAIVQSDFGRKPLKPVKSKIGVIITPRGDRLFFRQYNLQERSLQDLFWVHSPHYIFHIEKLHYFHYRPPEGFGVDIIQRSADKMKKVASYTFCEFPELSLSTKDIQLATTHPQDLSISHLISLWSRFGSSQSQRAHETIMALCKKCYSPFLALLAFLFPAPFCFLFERRLPQALLIFLALSFLFCFQLFIQSWLIIARASFFSGTPILIAIPWIIALYIGGRQLHKTSG